MLPIKKYHWFFNFFCIHKYLKTERQKLGKKRKKKDITENKKCVNTDNKRTERKKTENTHNTM